MTITKPGGPSVPLNLYRVSSPGLARVTDSVLLTEPGAEEARHITFSLEGLHYPFCEGQSMGVLPPGRDARGRPHKLRLYSIASSRTGEDGSGQSAALCVRRVQFLEPSTGRLCRGVASNYLCDLKVGDAVKITGPAGHGFLLPADPASNLILVATGTGIAPFRAFLRHIYLDLPRWSGAVYLFFGVRTEAECLYRAELESFRDRPGFQLIYAFSRQQKTPDGHRLYVQHRMAERIDELRSLLSQENTYFYICGLKGMEAGIETALAGPEDDGWPSFEALRREGRLRTETY